MVGVLVCFHLEFCFVLFCFFKDPDILGKKSEENSSKSCRNNKIFSSLKTLMFPLKLADG